MNEWRVASGERQGVSPPCAIPAVDGKKHGGLTPNRSPSEPPPRRFHNLHDATAWIPFQGRRFAWSRLFELVGLWPGIIACTARGDAHAVKLLTNLLHELVYRSRDTVLNVTGPAEGGAAVFVQV